MNPSILEVLVLGKPFLIYIALTCHALGALFMQNNEQCHE